MPTTKVNENAELVLGNGTEVLEPPAPNVVEALRRVMRDLPAIGKDQKASPQQGGYAYRGIEDITTKAQPLLARHGVLFAPRISSWSVREIEVNGKPWTDDRMEVTYRVYGPGGTEDYIDVGPIPAIGRDNSDKGSNKCMTQAYKYALIQTFCIADKADDADGTTHEADRYSQTGPRAGAPRGPEEEPTSAGNLRRGPRLLEGWANPEEQKGAHDAYVARGKEELTEPQREALKAWTAEQGISWPMTAAEMTMATAELERILASEEPF